MQLFHINMCQHGELRLSVAGLEKLRVQVDRQIVQFLLREERVFDLLFRFLLRAVELFGREVSSPRLDRISLRHFQSYF